MPTRSCNNRTRRGIQSAALFLFGRAADISRGVSPGPSSPACPGRHFGGIEKNMAVPVDVQLDYFAAGAALHLDGKILNRDAFHCPTPTTDADFWPARQHL